MTTSASDGTLAGEFRLWFNGEYATFDANADNVDANACAAAIEALRGVDSATCTLGAVDANKGREYTITFTTFAELGGGLSPRLIPSLQRFQPPSHAPLLSCIP